MTQICSKCNTQKEASCFNKNPKTKSGLTAWCKECNIAYCRKRRENSDFVESERIKQAGRSRKIRENRTPEEQEEFRKKRNEDRKLNKDEVNAKKRSWVSKRTPEQRKQYSDSFKIRAERDPCFKLARNLRTRLRQTIKYHRKSGSAVSDLGCSLDEFYLHLESKFQPGMSWDNWGAGKGKWHIDHIIPLSAFDLTQRQHLVLACYYLNMQPMWSEENISKGNRY